MSKAPNKIFLPIETKVREFHGKLFFSLIAAEQGFDVILGGQRELQDNIHSFSPGIYMDKSIADTKQGWFRRSRALGNVMCSWDEEGLVVFDADTYFRLRICKELFEKVSLFFAWGHAEADAILTRIPDAGQKVCVTGNPRFDLLRPELRSFHDLAVKTLRTRFGRILLVNTNFAFANFFSGEEKLQEVYRAYKISEQPGFFEGWAEAQRVSFHAFHQVIPVLSSRYPAHTIVIRPHPSESFAPWLELASTLPNVVVNGEGNVHEWILAADLMVHFNCTTGIEAYFLGVPSISFRLPGNEAFCQPLPNQLSIECDNHYRLFDLIDEILKNPSEYPKLSADQERNAVARAHVSGMEGPFASERIVAGLMEIESSQKASSEDLDTLVPIHKRLWRKVLGVFRRPDPKDQAYQLKKFPGMGIQEVSECIENFQRITGRFQRIEARRVGENCFLITRK
jgi:surface carbohydrate biosynthesis protein